MIGLSRGPAAVIGVAVLLMSSTALAAVRPAVWDQFPRLICRSDGALTCDRRSKTCSDRTHNALWVLDFPAKRVVYQTVDYEERIVSVFHSDSGPLTVNLDAAFLSSGRTMTFGQVEYPIPNVPSIRMTLLGEEGSSISHTTYSCSVARP